MKLFGTKHKDQEALLKKSSTELVGLAQGGNRSAFEELYRRYYPAVVKRLTHLMGPSSATGDLVQETFIKVYQNLPKFRSQSPFSHWVLRISTNVARSHYRKAYRSVWRLWDRPEVEELIPSPGESVEESFPRLDAVHQALAHLSPSLREAVVLFELEGASLAEMSVEMGIPLHTAASRVRRGRKKLRKILERMGFAPTLHPAVALCTGEPQ